MSDEIDLSHVEIQDHNELMDYIRILLEKIRLLTALYDDNLTLLTDHNEAANAHADIRALLLDNGTDADTKLDNLRTEIDGLTNNITSMVNALENRVNDLNEVNDAQNRRLDSAERNLGLKINDSAVSGVGHTGDFDDVLYRPNITISDADKTNTGAFVKLTKNRTELYLPSTIKAKFVGNITGNVIGDVTGAVTGNASSATKLQTPRTINGADFDGSTNITTAIWGTARNISITDGTNTGSAVSVNGSGNVVLQLPTTINANVSGNIKGASSSCTGNSATATTAGAVRASVASDSTKDLVYATMADNDCCRIRCGGTSDAGYLEIATGDNGNDPIYVRQFNGEFSSVARTLTLLDGNGNTTLPGRIILQGNYQIYVE